MFFANYDISSVIKIRRNILYGRTIRVHSQFLYVTGICKTTGGKECILPFVYSANTSNPEVSVRFWPVMEFQGCANNRSRGLWCPTKLFANNGTFYVDGEDGPNQEWEPCNRDCIRHGYE